MRPNRTRARTTILSRRPLAGATERLTGRFLSSAPTATNAVTLEFAHLWSEPQPAIASQGVLEGGLVSAAHGCETAQMMRRASSCADNHSPSSTLAPLRWIAEEDLFCAPTRGLRPLVAAFDVPQTSAAREPRLQTDRPADVMTKYEKYERDAGSCARREDSARRSAHKGVDHEPAGATTVRFCLPIAEQKPAAIVQGQSPFAQTGGGR